MTIHSIRNSRIAASAAPESQPVLSRRAHRWGLKTSKKANGGRIYFDLTDVQNHALWHTSCSGIQRVQLEVATTLLRTGQNIVPFSLYGGIWRNLRADLTETSGDSDAILRRLKEGVPFPGVYPSLKAPVQTIRLICSRLITTLKRALPGPKFTSADVVFIGGAFWTSPDVVTLCKKVSRAGASLVVLLHDLIPLVHPEFMGHDYSTEFREILRLPAHFIVTTEYNRGTLKSVRRDLGLSDDARVSVVPLAHEFPGTARNAPKAKTPKRLHALQNTEFVLNVGTVEIRKNHLMLFSIWDELAAEYGDHLPPLVVAGRRGWKANGALERLDDIFESSRLIFVESPTDEELRWLYSACSFTVFPSLYEGWGLPVGESLWFGKPCATSDTSSIPFVGGDLCTYFSPLHASTIKDAMYALFDQTTRRSIRKKILKAPLRTWSEVAVDVAEVVANQRLRSEAAAATSTSSSPMGAISQRLQETSVGGHQSCQTRRS